MKAGPQNLRQQTTQTPVLLVVNFQMPSKYPQKSGNFYCLADDGDKNTPLLTLKSIFLRKISPLVTLHSGKWLLTEQLRMKHNANPHEGLLQAV